MSVLASIRALKQAAAEANGDLRELHLAGMGVQSLLDELNAEQGRTIDPAPKGQALPPGTDPDKVKFGPSSVVFVEGVHVLHDPT